MASGRWGAGERDGDLLQRSLATTAVRSSSQDVSARRGVDLAAEPGRLVYLDNLKVGLVAAIIAGHAVIGYAAIGSWPYQDVQEARLGSAAETAFTLVLGPPALFAMGLFLLLAGLLTPGSLARKGPGRFVGDRLLRVGLPWAAFALVGWPLLTFAMYRVTGAPGSYWWRFTHAEPPLDSGPLWFLAVLLLYSLGYAGWRQLRGRHRPAPSRFESIVVFTGSGALGGRQVVAVAAGIAIATFLVRLRFPLDSVQVANLKLWQWPQYLAMFGLGIMSGRHGWLAPVPDRLRRGCGLAALAATLTLTALVVVAEALGLDSERFAGGWHWPAGATAAAEGVLAVTASLWLLGFAQRRLGQRGRLARALARSAYAAFVLQGPALVAVALALRPLAPPVEVKALAAAVAGVAGSFALAGLLVDRTRVGRIL